MLVSYATTKLLKLCTTQQKLVAKFGKKCAEEIGDRITTLMAMPTLSGVPVHPPERRHKLEGKRKGQWSVDAHGGVRLCFIPANDSLPLNHDSSIDITLVTEIEIVFLGDYHGET